jgi:hypothetical protein
MGGIKMTYSTSLVIVEVTPNPGLKTLIVQTPATTISGEISVFNLTDYGIATSGLLSIVGVAHSGSYSMIAERQQVYCTTSSSGVIQITNLPDANSVCGTGIRVYTIIGKSG